MSATHSNVHRTAFDGIADSYDSTFTYSSVGQAQRSATWDAFRKAFRPGDRVLDLGCGTGIDGWFLAGQGVKVLAVDSSAEMIRVARERLASHAKQTPIEFEVTAIEDLRQLKDRGPFDGLVSNFAALNCVEDLRRVARDSAELLRPGATALLCFLGPICLWEVIWHVARRNPEKAFRRWKKNGTIARLADGSALRIRYPRVRSLARTFAPEFRLKSWKGIGVAVPPSYTESLVGRFPRTMRFATKADAIFGRCRGTRGLADHVLLEFVRK